MEVRVKLPSLYGWQQDLVNQFDNPKAKKSAMVAVSRRAGKTYTATTIAIKSLLNGKRVLWISPEQSQYEPIFQSIEQICEEIIGDKEKNKQIRLITGGSIIFKSTHIYSGLRSRGYDLIIFDEMSHAKNLKEIWSTIRPCLTESANSRFLGISTPNGLNYWHELWQLFKETNPNEWEFLVKDWRCSPHLTEEAINSARMEMSVGKFKQEHEACFLQIEGSYFPSEYFKDIFVDNIPPPDHYQRKCVSIDLSCGYLLSDWQACTFIGVKDGILYVDCQAKLMPVEELVVFVKSMCDYYKPEFTAWEVNGFQALGKAMFERLYNVPQRAIGVNNKEKKETRIRRLDYLLKDNKIKILKNDGGKECLKEFVNFPNPTRDKDIHDDILDAIEMGWRALVET